LIFRPFRGKLKGENRRKEEERMGDLQAKNWRREQKVMSQEPEMLISKEELEARQQARRRQELEQEQILETITYRSEGNYTRDARTARDGKGSMRGKRVQVNKKYASRRLIAGALAALMLVGGGISYARSQSPNHAPREASTTQMEMAGVGTQELGLSPELRQRLKEYEAFFDYFDETQEITEEAVLAKIAEIDQLKDEVLSHKLGSLFGVPYYEVEPGELHFDIKSGDSGASIQVGKDIRLGNSVLPIFKKNDISKDIIAYLQGFSRIDELAQKVRDDRISKVAAIKRLGNVYFERIEVMANAEFSKDEKNNVHISYAREKEVNNAAKKAEIASREEEMERD